MKKLIIILFSMLLLISISTRQAHASKNDKSRMTLKSPNVNSYKIRKALLNGTYTYYGFKLGDSEQKLIKNGVMV